MSNQPIEFRKQRELGELITDTFKFLRENFKPLLKVIFKVAGPVFLILLLAIAYFSYLGMDLFENPLLVDTAEVQVELYLISLFILLSSLIAFYVLLYGSVLHYIKSYIENAGVVNETEVYQGVKNNFGRLLGLVLLTGIITIIGLALCILPGIFVWVPLTIAPAVLIFRNNAVTNSISDSFNLVKDNWWVTFFSLFVITLLIYIIGMIFQFPLIVYVFVKTLTSVQEGSVANPGDMVDWVYVTLNVLSSLFQYLLSVVIVVAAAFIYYDLDEKKNATGSYERIAGLGASDKQ